MTPPPFRLIEIDEDHAKGTAWNVLFMIWRRRTDAAAFRRGILALTELTRAFPQGVGACQVVEVDAIPPDSAAREAFLELHRKSELRHSSVIHDGSGFKAASVRAIMTSVLAVARASNKVSVFSSVEEAARWHVDLQRPLSAPRFDSGEFTQVVSAMRAEHRKRFQ